MSSVFELPRLIPKEFDSFLAAMRPLEGKQVKITFKRGSGSPCVVTLCHARVVKSGTEFRPELAVRKIWTLKDNDLYTIEYSRVHAVSLDIDGSGGNRSEPTKLKTLGNLSFLREIFP